MPRKVILPTEVSNNLDNLVNITEEVSGVLFYRPTADYCAVESMFILGVGLPNKVIDDEHRLKVTNTFFQQNPEYHYIKFHTHSKQTIYRYGEYFAENFSSQDLNEINKNIKLDKYFMAILVTPKIKLIMGYDSPLMFIGNYPEYKELHNQIQQKLETIASNLGYELNPLVAKLK